MTVIFENGITVGPGVGVGAVTPGFTISSADFTNYNWGSQLTPNGNTGFTTTGLTGPGEAFYAPVFSLDQGGSAAKLAEIRNNWLSRGLSTNYSYMFNVVWGAGSTLNGGVVIMEFRDFGDNNNYLDMGVVDTSDPIWQTPGTGYYNGPIKTLLGTWNFPATFSLVYPIIQNGSNWC